MQLNKGLSIMVQNTTSAVDAVQCLTGCTLGNQRLVVQDFGKHNYTFISHHSNRAAELKMKDICYPDQESFHALEKTLAKQKGTVQQVARLQAMLDEWVKWLLAMEDCDVFEVRETSHLPPQAEMSSKYLVCGLCQDPVLVSRAVKLHGHFVCFPCAQWAQESHSDIVWH